MKITDSVLSITLWLLVAHTLADHFCRLPLGMELVLGSILHIPSIFPVTVHALMYGSALGLMISRFSLNTVKPINAIVWLFTTHFVIDGTKHVILPILAIPKTLWLSIGDQMLHISAIAFIVPGSAHFRYRSTKLSFTLIALAVLAIIIDYNAPKATVVGNMATGSTSTLEVNPLKHGKIVWIPSDNESSRYLVANFFDTRTTDNSEDTLTLDYNINELPPGLDDISIHFAIKYYGITSYKYFNTVLKLRRQGTLVQRVATWHKQTINGHCSEPCIIIYLEDKQRKIKLVITRLTIRSDHKEHSLIPRHF